MNTRLILAAAAALALAACTGGEPTAVQARAPAPPRATGEQNPRQNIFGLLAPVSSFIPADSATEYGIRFKSSVPGRVVSFRVYTFGPGTYAVRLRNDHGDQMGSGKTVTITNPATFGWQTVIPSTAQPLLVPGIHYRVSVRSRNARLGKTDGFFVDSTFTNKNLTATNGFIYVPGFPDPVITDTTTAYFVDVIFQPESDPE